ncbi:MAG: hypothetical protein CUN55_13860, partial [Phototrophicales bacterium]
NNNEVESFNTRSGISYAKRDFTQQVDSNGAVTVSRDLHIEQLSMENLSIDNLNNSPSLGDITLSNWRSVGDTTITPR